jgi:hypothetical protein
MSTNARCVRFGCFLNKRRERRVLLRGAKGFLYIISILILHFGEIRYESSARVADPLSIDVFRNNRRG